jgi:uncharacterized protein YkwD
MGVTAMFGSTAAGVVTSLVLGFAVPTSAESEVVRLTNDVRVQHGCPAVRQDNRLTTAARRHSADMARNNFFSHTGSDGSDFSTRAKRAGYVHAMSENIAKGYPSAGAVVEGWLGSEPHRRAILDCTAKAVGVGVARARDGALLWTQDFGRA